MRDTIKSVAVPELHEFPDNPFKVIQNEDFTALVESIKDFGVISPLVVRPLDTGGYQIISGHRRALACKEAGIEKVPTFVREMDRDAAIIALVDSNLHREHILPSEKAYAFKMKLEAIKHQGMRTDITSVQVAPKLSAEIIGDEQGISKDQVKRYIRLTNLIPELLKLVDSADIAISPAVELSYLTEKEQNDLLLTIESEEATPSFSQTQRMKQLSQEGNLSVDKIFEIITEEKANQKEQIKFKIESIRSFFPKDYSVKQIEETILKLLTDWQKKRAQRQKDRDSR